MTESKSCGCLCMGGIHQGDVLKRVSLQKCIRQVWGMMKMFSTLIIVIVSQKYAYSKSHINTYICIFKYLYLLYINYTSKTV